MHWIKIDDSHRPENDTLYAISIWNKIYKRSIPADAFAIFRNNVWYWWVDGETDKVEEKVAHYMQLLLPEEQK